MQRLDLENLKSKDGGKTICALTLTKSISIAVDSIMELVSLVLQTPLSFDFAYQFEQASQEGIIGIIGI